MEGATYRHWWHAQYDPGGGDAPSPLLTDLKAWYKQDETSGVRFDTVDSFDLTDNNTVEFKAGVIGNAAKFVAANSEYLSRAAFSANPATNVSWACWVEIAEDNAWRGIFRDAYVDMRYYDAGAGPTNFMLQSNFYDGAWKTASTGWIAGGNAGWHHVALVYEESANVTLYWDGTPYTTAVGTISGGAGDFWIGRSINNNYQNAGIDLFGLWERDITSDDVSELRNGGAGKDHPF